MIALLVSLLTFVNNLVSSVNFEMELVRAESISSEQQQQQHWFWYPNAEVHHLSPVSKPTLNHQYQYKLVVYFHLAIHESKLKLSYLCHVS